jgi:Ni/Fe-hydrogenase 1 B-type cytochrome subunit
MSTTSPERLADVTGIDESAVSHGQTTKSVYVYEAPVRLWHWINAASITVLALTGYFIGQPLPTMPGEASARRRPRPANPPPRSSAAGVSNKPAA